MPSKGNGRSVRDLYKWTSIVIDLTSRTGKKPTLRQKAAAINQAAITRGLPACITYGTVDRLERGIEPKDPIKRRVLGLPALIIPAPICPHCFRPKISSRCNHGKKRIRRIDWKAETRKRDRTISVLLYLMKGTINVETH